MDEDPDLASARAGDYKAFVRLIKKHDEQMRRMISQVANGTNELDDILQDAYLRAFKGLGKFDGRSTFTTWLYRIAVNAAIDAHRRHRKDHAHDVLVDLHTSQPSHEDGVVARHDLRAALSQLSHDHRLAVMLVDAQGVSYADASEILDISIGTLSSRLHHARLQLRRTLQWTSGGGR